MSPNRKLFLIGLFFMAVAILFPNFSAWIVLLHGLKLILMSIARKAESKFLDSLNRFEPFE